MINSNYRYRFQGRKLKIVVRIFIILALFANFFAFIPSNSEGSLVVLTFDAFDKSSKSASVRPGENIPVFFEGNISIRKFPVAKFQQIDVMLGYEDPGDQWSVSLFPPLLTFTPGVIRNSFRVAVLPYPQALHLDNKKITITGSWMATPSAGTVLSYGEMEPIKISVNVQQFYRINVYEEPVIHYVWPGDTVEYELIVQNQGNGDDTFEISIENEADLARYGYGVTINKSSIDIPAKSQRSVGVTVYGARPLFHPWRISNTEIQIRVISQGAKRNQVHYEAATVREGSFYYYENGPIVSEPCWAGIILIIVIVVSFVVHRRRQFRKWKGKKIKRKDKKKGKTKTKHILEKGDEEK